MKLKIGNWTSYIAANHMSKHATIKNGPNGISLFIVNPRVSLCEIDVGVNVRKIFFHASEEMNTSRSDTTAPITNAPKRASNPSAGPSSHPTPSVSLASPNPIHRPRENSHSAKSGSATRGPASRVSCQGNAEAKTNASALNDHTHRSGIIVCLKSYVAIATSSATTTQPRIF